MPKNPYALAVEAVRAAILNAYEEAAQHGELPAGAPEEFDVSEPRDKGHGDLAANFAMVWAKALKLNPRKVAETVVAGVDKGDFIEKIEIAGPGFVNVSLNAAWYGAALSAIDEAGDDYGKSGYGAGKRVQVEFVSANPTGPMHLGNARGGVLGDVLSSIFQWTGFYCEREFYLNDTGNQVDLLGKSMESRFFELLGDTASYPFPEDGYHGEDVIEHAKAYRELHGDALKDAPEEERRIKLRDFALTRNIERMKEDLARYRIVHDVWFKESSLYGEGGAVDIALAAMKENDALYEADGALWFAATKFGSEKDEVLRKSTGFYTYYMGDIAYHYNKFVTRGFDTVVDIWGADHHGHAIRFASAMRAIGLEPTRLKFILMQLVRLVRGGEIVRMSKRTGKAVTLSNLLDEISVDAARFFFCSRQNDTQMEFDLDIAVKEDSDNPVYYVQYAHARICSILRNLAAEGVTPKSAAEVDFSVLTAPEEADLIKHLAKLPQELIMAADSLDPSRMTKYVMETASTFHKFYNACRVRGEEQAVMDARLKLCELTAQVLRNVLSIINVTCPDRM
ncbi:MAG TPA: arginine--tRNA ligase [Candidatus Acidoferrum sp.]|nr:arginine--tRNA ligase [Candidatus Acidoferrum sp.]